MIKRIALLSVLIFSILFSEAQERALTRGMRIGSSIKIRKGVYKLDATDQSKPVIQIQGNDIIIDFKDALLKGSNNKTEPDGFFGTGIQISNSRNVTIRNLKVRGYKIGLLVKNVDKLVLENCDFSYNYRQHLNSTQEKEDLSDWMSYHENENDEWLRYGAGIYLRDCQNFTVRNCRVNGGQNALMLMRCNDGMIYNNDFSFNSGIGIGMYRSSRNQVAFNKIDFNVRGYSHGVYNRGQDSAGILVYEQSSENVFYRNSATHCGDGFFLWAGRSTLDTGVGGCNDNLVWRNDFSYAPTNGIEVTFSRNRISGNRLFECDYGIWGGYSFDTRINDNQFRNNRVGIAIEHGLRNTIDYNIFLNDKQAIQLWANERQSVGGNLSTLRDTRSAGYTIAMNSFNSNPVAIDIRRTDSVNIFGNTYSSVETPFRFDSSVTNLDSFYTELEDATLSFPDIKSPQDPFQGMGKYAGRRHIMVGEWGPYDFRSPLIWQTNPTEKGDTLRFDILGPKGNWVVKSTKGVRGLSATRGVFPASVTAIRVPSSRIDMLIELEYKGEGITTPFGEARAANQPYRFRFRKFFQPIAWDVLFFSLDTAFHNPLTTGQLFAPTVRMAPVKEEKVDRLDYAWWGGLPADRVYKQFMTVASGKAELLPGEYELSVTWDDAVRVYVDNKMVIDEWRPAKLSFDESPNRKIRLKLGGNHDFRVEHLELGGFATLALKLRRIG